MDKIMCPACSCEFSAMLPATCPECSRLVSFAEPEWLKEAREKLRPYEES